MTALELPRKYIIFVREPKGRKMKTISGHCVLVKDISVSKAAKILTKFVSADNGTSHVINAYLHRPSASFNELKQLHKELG
ncbi:hypothetical protein JHK87_004567 [Glycine soja]|nr:hypothetical protein JHK87_004567 [Glycine soja]